MGIFTASMGNQELAVVHIHMSLNQPQMAHTQASILVMAKVLAMSLKGQLRRQ